MSNSGDPDAGLGVLGPGATANKNLVDHLGLKCFSNKYQRKSAVPVWKIFSSHVALVCRCYKLNEVQTEAGTRAMFGIAAAIEAFKYVG